MFVSLNQRDATPCLNSLDGPKQYNEYQASLISICLIIVVYYSFVALKDPTSALALMTRKSDTESMVNAIRFAYMTNSHTSYANVGAFFIIFYLVSTTILLPIYLSSNEPILQIKRFTY